MARVKIRVAYKDLNEGVKGIEKLVYGVVDIRPYDSKSSLCDEMAGAMAFNIAKDRVGHNNIKITDYSHEEAFNE